MKNLIQKSFFIPGFLAMMLLASCSNLGLQVQGSSRFLKVKGWKVHYEIEKRGMETSPDEGNNRDAELPNFFDDAEVARAWLKLKDSDRKTVMTDPYLRTATVLYELTKLMNHRLKTWDELKGASVSTLISNSKVTGDCILDHREDDESWSGSGKIKYDFDEKSAGFMLGSKSYGLLLGSGETSLFSEESVLTIYPHDGTYEILLIPGDGDNTGMRMKTASHDAFWEEMIAGVQLAIGNASAEAVIEQMPEIQKKYPPETVDAFNALSDRYFVFSLEGEKLPAAGLTLEGETVTPGNFRLKWKITPLE